MKWFILLGEQPLQVARCTKIINADTDDPKYIINVKQFAKFVVDLGDQVAPTDIEEGMRVGYVWAEVYIYVIGFVMTKIEWQCVRLCFVSIQGYLIVIHFKTSVYGDLFV